jgi:hypothetical protein
MNCPSVLAFTGAIAAILSGAASAVTYYVSPNGNDSNTGLDPASAWRTVSKVNSTSFDPGSQILFERAGQWREQLLASSSGAPGQPITYDAYGSGPKPRFWGSDVLNKSGFQLVPGSSSTYQITTERVHSVLIDHQFSRSAALLTSGTDPTAYINYVKSNPNTWYYDSGRLYLNTGGVNPAGDNRLYTGVVRDDVVSSNFKNNLVFRNLIVDESARYNAGYAFRVQSSDNVLIESSEAYRAGKHHFGVINANGFVGKNLYAAQAMPDQGYGGASAYVSYSDHSRTNVIADDPLGPYPGFITHGTGMGDILIQNMEIRGGAGMALYSEGENQTIRVQGGLVENGAVSVDRNTTIDGLTVTGPYGSIGLARNNNIVENTVVSGRSPDFWAGHRAAILDSGQNNIIRYNTIILDPEFSGRGAAIGINGSATNSEIYANVITDPHAILMYAGAAPIDSFANLYAPDSIFGFMEPNGQLVYRTLAQWKSMGYEMREVQIGDANFDGVIDADDYALIDAGFFSRNHLAGFHNGDFDLSGGPPDADDLFLIDRAFANQWLLQSPAQYTLSVPEVSCAVLPLLACLLSRRKR